MGSTAKRIVVGSVLPPPCLEQLEARCLLDAVPPLGSAPYLGTSLADHYFTTTASLTIGVDGQDDDPGDHVVISAVADNPNVVITIPTGDKFARLHFAEEDGNPIGDVIVELFNAAGGAATQRFITLATNAVDNEGNLDPNGTPFYSDVAVHRVIPDFMIQTGDAVNGDGSGGSPLGDFPDAFDPALSFSGIGALAMANSGPDTNDSQFFITDGATTWLDGVHMIFGQVIAGQDIVREISNIPRDSNDRPYSVPLLEYVDIFDSYQDGTLIVQARNGFVGDANVTVTLADSQGHTASEQFGVTFGGVLRMAPGSTASYNVDFTGLAAPEIASSYSGATVSLDANAGTATVTVPAGYTGMFKVQIADGSQVVREDYVYSLGRTDPLALDRIATLPQSGVLCLRQEGNFLYVGREPASSKGAGGLDVYDVSDPSNPLLLDRFHGTFTLPGTQDTSDLYLFHDIELKGNTLLANAVMRIWHEDQNRVEKDLVAFDVSNPQDIKVLGVQPITDGTDIFVDGNVAYVAGGAAGIYAFDVTDPAHMTQLANIVNLTGSLTITYAAGVVARNGYVFVNAWVKENSNEGVGIVVLDATNTSAIRFVGIFGAGNAWGIDLQGTRLFVADYQGNLGAYDVSRPTAVKLLGSVPVTGSPQQVEVDGNLAVVTTDKGYSFFDVTDPKKMVARTVLSSSFTDTIDPQKTRCHLSVAGAVVAIPLAGEGFVLFDDVHTLLQGKRTFAGENGTAVTINIKNGQAILTTSGFIQGSIEGLEVITSTSATTVSITAKAEITLGDIVVHGSLGSFTAKTANLFGDITVEGVLAKVVLGDVAGGVTIDLNTLGADIDPKLALALTFDGVADCLLDTGGIPIKSLSAAWWHNGDGNALNDKITSTRLDKLNVKYDFAASLEIDSVSSPIAMGSASVGGSVTGGLWDISGGSLNKLTVKGNMGADLTLNYVGDKPALGSASVGGDVAGGTWNVTGAIGKVAVTGTVSGSRIIATGNITSIAVGAVYDSDFLAGFDAAFTDHHAGDHDDFATSPPAVLGSFSITKLKLPSNVAPPQFYMDNTNISAAAIGKVSLVNADFTDCGLYACKSAIGGEVASVKHTDTVLKTTWTWPSKGLLNDPEGYVRLL